MADIDFKNKKTYIDLKKQSSAKLPSDSSVLLLEEKKKKKTWWIILVVVLIVAIITVFIIDVARKNNSIKVQNVKIVHSALPKSFDGYKILQISDLDGKEFGDRQEDLIKIVKGLDYDMILLTGDYVDKDDKKDVWPLLDLLEGIGKEKPIYYVLGEADVVSDRKSGDDDWMRCIIPADDNTVAIALNEFGAIPVYPAQKITSEKGEHIYLTGIRNNSILEDYDFEAETDFSICVTHKPIDYNVTSRLRDVNTRIITEIDYDVSISGHTLGGQYRLPLLGAVYLSGHGLFPQERYVYGLHEDSSGRVNYISGGLGVQSGFRLGITPEITVIELKTETK